MPPVRQHLCCNMGLRLTIVANQATAVLLLALLLVLGNSIASAQDITTVDAVDSSTAAAQAASTTVSPFSPVGRSTVGGRSARVPAGAKLTERHPMVSSLQNPQTVTQQELQEKAATEPPGAILSSDAGDVSSQANGNAGATYSDSRLGTGPDYTSIATRRVGRLSMRFGGQWYTCSASVIKKALLVTAAHCVFQYGKGSSGWPDRVNNVWQVTFEPGLDNTNAPLGRWGALSFVVPTPYFSGTDTNGGSTPGVVVNNDIALVWVSPLNNRQIGDVTGWLGYGWDSFSFAAPAAGFGVPTVTGMPAMAQLTQFGYPAVFDNGVRMQISNAATYMMTSGVGDLKNIIRGSSMTGGSSGGPWVANYGVDAVLNKPSEGSYGSNNNRNIIMGVTSWGYTDANIKVQGASFFGRNRAFPDTYGTRGAGNIAKLMYDACDNPAGWQLAAKGLC